MSRFVLTAQLQLQAPNNVNQVVQQIQNQLNGVTVNVQVQNARQAQRQLSQITQGANQATTAAERMGRAFALSVRRFAAFSIATRAVGLFTSTLADATQNAIDFERQLIKVAQVTGKSIGQLRGLTKQITSLSTGFGVASSDLLEVSTVLAQAGLSAEDTAIALKTLAKAALAPNFDSITETAEGAIAILAQFQEGVGSLEKQLGSINAVAGAFAVEASDLIDVIRRTGGVFKSSGGNLNELLALFTSVRATTRESAESIGTGLRTIFTRIQRPKTIEFLKQFGVELVDLNGKFVGPFEAVKRLSEALSGLGEGDITFIRIAEELGGFRQIGKVLPLLQQFSTAQSALNVAMKAGDSLTQDAASAQAALAVRIMKVKEEFLALIRSMTETSTFQIMANTALSLASALIKIADSIKPLLPMLAALAAIKLVRGMSSFFGGIMSGATSGRTYNKGGKVLGFARGGLVPGSGNRDTVPAMLSPGEFVIRKSSVNKMGAGTLAAMNENRYALGGEVEVGAAVLKGRRGSAPTIISYNDIMSAANTDKVKQSVSASIPESKTYQLIKDPLDKEGYEIFKDAIDKGLIASVNSANSILAKTLNVPTPAVSKAAPQIKNFTDSLNDAARGNLFETIITSMLNKGNWESEPDPQRPFDFMGGVRLAAPSEAGPKLLFPRVANLDYVDAKASMDAANKENMAKKIANQLDREGIRMMGGEMPGQQVPLKQKLANGLELGKEYTAKELEAFNYRSVGSMSLGRQGFIKSKVRNAQGNFTYKMPESQTRHFGGIIQKFATGGIVQQGNDSYLESDVIKAMSEIRGKQLTREEAISEFLRKNEDGDLYYTNYGIPGKSKKLPKWFAPTRATSAVEAAVYSAIVSKQDRIDASRRKRGLPTIEHVGQSLEQKNFLKARRGYATGGSVGTDTVPALLTPGEFVVNRSSAQRIGYGALNRMNKVGKYAKGGVVQHFASGSSGSGVQNPFASMGGTMGAKANNVAIIQLSEDAKNTSKSMKDVVNSNKMFAASMTTSMIQGFLPALDEGSSAMLKITHNLLGLVTTITSVGFALESFGLNLSKGQLMNFFRGKGLNTQGLQNIFSSFRGLGANKGLAGSLTGFTNNLIKLAGPLAAIGSSAYIVTKAFSAVIEGVYDFDGALKKAINKGDVQAAAQAAGEKQSFENANAGRAIGATGGAALGFIAGGPIGAAVGAALGAGISTIISNIMSEYFPELFEGLSYLFGGNTRASAVAMAEAQAQATKTTKALEKGQKDAQEAMQDFQNGTISAADALKKINYVQEEVNALGSKTSYAMATNDQNRSKGAYATARNVFTLGGILGESASARNSRIDKENADQNKAYMDAQRQSFAQSAELRNATMRSAAARNLSSEEAYSQLGAFDPRNLRAQAEAAGKQAQQAYTRGDIETGDQLNERFKMLVEQAREVEKAFENIKKETERARAAFNAMNLGLRGPTATANALSANMQKFASGLEVGNNAFITNTQFLSEALSSAAQAMSANDIKDAISNVSKNLGELGLSKDLITKFEGNVGGFIQAQQKYNAAFNKIRANIDANIKAGNKSGNTPEEIKKAFAKELTVGLGEEARKNLTDIIANIPLTEDEVNKIIDGDLSVFGDKLTEAGRKQFEEIVKIAQERAKAEQVLIDFTKKRIDAERNLVQAQQDALDLALEGREIQSKYGGRAVSFGEERANILGKSNVEGQRLGLTGMRTGSIAELKQRNNEIRNRFAGIENLRTRPGGLQRKAGVEADEAQKDLQKAYKTQIDTIRNLIKLEEEQLKITQEKNKLEKESMESLVKGDVEEFFKKQAAVGATAAIASGDERLMRLYGADALGTAALDIQRQREAGVQSLYGQELGGAGGLAERAAGAALSSRGVTDLRAAQIMAGTTPEEEATKSRLRGLGGMLGETGNLGVEMASMEVTTSVVNLQAAQVTFDKTIEQGRLAAEQAIGKSRGGLIYASRGIFVPRGTDTIPAMLTPGEFVVNRAAVQRGNNLQVLQAMNNNSSNNVGGTAMMARGGIVRYRQMGSTGPESSSNDAMTKFSQSLNEFNTRLSENIQKLSQTNISIKLDSTSVNINLNDGGLLKAVTSQVKNELFRLIESEFKVDNGGKLRRNTTVLG